MSFFSTVWETPVGELPIGGARIELLESHAGLVAGKTVPEGCRAVFVLFPGNPGVPHFYHKFVMELTRRFPSLAVVVMGLAGHSLEDLNGQRVFELQDQLELATTFTRFVLRRIVNGGRSGGSALPLRLLCGGHSIGAFIAMAVTARFREVERCFMLTPTICNMLDSPNGRRNRHVLRVPIIHLCGTVVAPLLRALPAPAKRLVLRLTNPEMDAADHGIVMNMARGYLVKNVLFMAASEFRQLGSLDVPHLRDCQERLVFYFVRHDGWVPMSDFHLIREQAPQAAGMVLEGDCDVAHAWCLCHNHQVVENGIAPFLDLPSTS